MSETWWTLKYLDPAWTPPRECRAGAAFAMKAIARSEAERYRGLGARNVRVVPCDPPRLRTPLKEPRGPAGG